MATEAGRPVRRRCAWAWAIVAGTVVALGCLADAPVGAIAPEPLPRTRASDAGLSQATLDEATGLLKQFVAESKIAGAVAAVARRGKLVYLEAVGAQSIDPPVVMHERSLFRIYSMSKSVTAVAALMMVEAGRAALEDPVSRYLPEFADVRVEQPGGTTRPPARPVTVEDLLLHTSGLEHRTSREYQQAAVRSRAIDLSQFVRNIVRVPLKEDPGTRFRYSESSTVLGRLVEVWSGQPFDAFLAQRVFRPLRMDDTGFWAQGEQQKRLTTVYGPAPGGGLRALEIETVPFTERPALLEGAVGLLSTAGDYLRFAQMLANGGELDGVRLLRRDTVARSVANGLPAAVLAARGGGVMGWGLANVNVVMEPGRVAYPTARGEYGWDGSAGTIFWVDPQSELVTILLTQSSPADPDRLRARFKTLVQQAVQQR